MKQVNKEFLNDLDALASERIQAIRGTADNVSVSGDVYYVSNDGCDENNGLTPECAWKTLKKVSAPGLPFSAKQMPSPKESSP